MVLAGNKRNTTSNLTVERSKGKNGQVANSYIAHSREPTESAPLKQVKCRENIYKDIDIK